MLNMIKENKIVAITAALLALLVVVFVLWPSGSDPSASEPAAGHAETTQHEAGGEEAHAKGEHSEGEHAGEHAEGGARSQEVHLSSEQRGRLGIVAEELAAGSSTSRIERPATVRFNPDHTAQVGPRVQAKVVRVLKDLGDWVEAGEPVAIMSSMELGKAKAQYRTARARLETARTTYEREQALREKEISSEAELLEAKARYEEARAELDAAAETLRLYGLSADQIEESGESSQPASRFYLTSPISGSVQHRDLSPGETLGPDETPIHVANTSQMWVMIDAYERDMPVLEEGQDVVLSVRSLPEHTFRGQVDWISSALSEETRTVQVRARVSNEQGLLRAGMYGTAGVETGEEVAYPVIPADAVQRIEDREVVFVPGEEEGAFRAVPVQTGEESGDGMVELTAGLEPGDVAVTEGAFDLKAALTSGSRSAAHSH